MNRILLSMAVVLPVMMLVASPASAIREAGFQAVQQQQPVTGTVVDETGEPVIGATVLIEGGNATQGTITDFDGFLRRIHQPDGDSTGWYASPVEK